MQMWTFQPRYFLKSETELGMISEPKLELIFFKHYTVFAELVFLFHIFIPFLMIH